MKMASSKFIVNLHGASRNHNYGDVLLMAIYKSWIEEAGGEVIMDMANSYYGEYLGVDKKVPIKRAIRNADFIVYGGGGYFGEPRNPSLRWKIKFVLHHMLPAILARWSGKPYGFFGIGFGPLNNIFIRTIGMYAINGATIVSVRDKESKDYLEKYGYNKKIHIQPDSALSISSSDSPFFIEKKKISTAKIAFHIPLDPGNDLNQIKNYLTSFLSIISEKPGYEYVFVVDHGLGEECYQYKFFELLRKELNLNWYIHKYTTPEDTLKFISTCAVVVTTKLHVAITSYALGVKPIGVSKHPKTKRFFNQIGLSELHFDLYDLKSPDKVNDIIEKIFDDMSIEISEELVNQSKCNKNLLNEFLNHHSK